MSRPLDVVTALTRVVRDLQAPVDVASRLQALVAAAGDVVPGVDEAGIVVPTDDGPAVLAATGPLVARLVEVEARTGEGPGLATLAGGPTARLDLLGGSARWSSYVAGADEAGLCAQVAVPVLLDDEVAAVLHLCSVSESVVHDEALEIAELLAGHVALLLAHDRRVENLDAALQSRTTIGLALGMVMQRLDLDQDTAFAYLTRLSATSETKLRDVAAAMVQQHEERLTTRRDGSVPPGDA